MKKERASNKLESLCVKYLSKAISKVELDEFSQLLEEPANEDFFREYIRINYALDYNLTDYSTAKAKLLLLWNIENDAPEKINAKPVSYLKYAVAASIALLFCAGIYFGSNGNKRINYDNSVESVQTKVLPGSQNAVLTLENGEQLVLDEANTFKNDKVESDGKSIRYASSNKAKEIAYNYLTIPRGGEFFVTLSDGTKVWLNSDSKLKYPTDFVSGNLRKVELLYGEAYFDVSSSTENNGSRFRVITKDQEIEVLGTEFNIKAYKNDNFLATTLIEGRVAVTHIDSTVILKPTQQSIITDADSDIIVQTVDVDNEIAWKNGFFSFEKQSLGEMLKTLSRWYNVTVVYEDEEKKNFRFSGVLKRTSDLKELLRVIEKTERVSFEITDKTIVVK